MYARTTTVRGDPRAVDDEIAFTRSDLWPRIQQMDGCIGMSMLADRPAGRCILTSTWADQDAMRASADRIGELRRQVAEVLRADAVDIAEWEIAVLHRTRPPGDAACVRGTWVSIPAGHVDGMIDAFRVSLLPRLEDLPGFCSVSLLVDRLGARAVAAVTYADRAALERTREQGAALRESSAGR
jgi:quinol monooxygenase YgiN